jgi:hypothetical protein
VKARLRDSGLQIAQAGLVLDKDGLYGQTRVYDSSGPVVQAIRKIDTSSAAAPRNEPNGRG